MKKKLAIRFILLVALASAMLLAAVGPAWAKIEFAGMQPTRLTNVETISPKTKTRKKGS